MVNSSSKEEMSEKPEKVGKCLDGDEEQARYAHVRSMISFAMDSMGAADGTRVGVGRVGEGSSEQHCELEGQREQVMDSRRARSTRKRGPGEERTRTEQPFGKHRALKVGRLCSNGGRRWGTQEGPLDAIVARVRPRWEGRESGRWWVRGGCMVVYIYVLRIKSCRITSRSAASAIHHLHTSVD